MIIILSTLLIFAALVIAHMADKIGKPKEYVKMLEVDRARTALDYAIAKRHALILNTECQKLHKDLIAMEQMRTSAVLRGQRLFEHNLELAKRIAELEQRLK